MRRPSCHEENSPFSKGGILIKISVPLPLFLFSMDKQFVCDTNDYLLKIELVSTEIIRIEI